MPASLLVLAAFAVACAGGASDTSPIDPAPMPAPARPMSGPLVLTGSIAPVHDPSILEYHGTYFLFSTGNGRDGMGFLPIRTSADLHDWTYRGAVFTRIPVWAQSAIPGTHGLWAPDISRRNGEFRLYYSVSTFGSNRSAIGLATRVTLDPAAPQAGWSDRGEVIGSASDDDYNAIDPNVFDDARGRQWLVFGSFWSGIKMVRLDPASGMRMANDMTIRSLARRPRPDAIEGAYVHRRGGFYYLFASFDFCCRGAASTYRTVVGRAVDPIGPYVDESGRAMLDGGGTEVLASGQGTGDRFVGRGHVSILHDSGGTDYIVYHAYDTQNQATPNLRIQALRWSSDGWPTAI